MQALENEFFDSIGSFGLWQRVLYCILFYSIILGTWQNYAMTFLAPNVPFRCTEPPSANATFADSEWPGQCSVHTPNVSGEVPCTRWEYDTTDYSDTLVSEWDLVCSREWLISFSKSLFNIGYMASIFTFGQISDWIGRRPTLLVCYIINCMAVTLSVFSTSVEMFFAFRFLQAFGRTSFNTLGIVLLMETVGPRHRTLVTLTIQLGCGTGMVVNAFVGYFVRHWFWFQVALAATALLALPSLVFVPESPRWLFTHAKQDQLRDLIVTAAKRNKTDLKDPDDLINRLFESPANREGKKGTLLDLFRNTKMRCRTFIMMYLWAVNAFVYYAFSYNTNDFSGNPYVNFMLLGVLEILSGGLVCLASNFFGRRTITVFFMLFCGATCLALLAVPSDLPWLNRSLSQAGRFFVSASFINLYLQTGETFPTLVRSAAVGSCSTAARIGSIVAPFTREMGKMTHPIVPNILLSVLALSGGLFSLRLPETAGCKIPDTLEEAEEDFERQ